MPGYLAGCACLVGMAGLSIWTIADTVAPRWPQIVATLFPGERW